MTLPPTARWVHASEGSTDPTDITMRQYRQFMDKVRETPSWPRSWANFSLF